MKYTALKRFLFIGILHAVYAYIDTSTASIITNRHDFHIYTDHSDYIKIFQDISMNISSSGYGPDVFDSAFSSFSYRDRPDVCSAQEHVCLIHYSPDDEDLTCLVKPPVKPLRVSTLFTGNISSYEEVWLFVVDAIGLSLYSYPHMHSTIRRGHYKLVHPNTQCDVIDYASFNISDFMSSFWLPQRPVVLKNFFRPVNRDRINAVLREFENVIVGAKLSPTSSFEGVDQLMNWEMAKEQHVPRDILDQMESPDLVVVRPVHEEMPLKNVLEIIKDTYHSGNRSNVYVEYMSLSDPSLVRMFSALAGVESSCATGNKNESGLDILLCLANWSRYLHEGNGYLWLGDGNTVGKVHFDPFDNLLLQVEGSKIFHLIDPSDNTRMYEGHMREAQLEATKLSGPFESLNSVVGSSASNRTTKYSFKRRLLLESTSMVHSPVDMEAIRESKSCSVSDGVTCTERSVRNKERYVLSSSVETVDCQVDKGDALWVPSFWWHEVTSLSSETKSASDMPHSGYPLNIAVNFWFAPLYEKKFPCSNCKKSKLNQKYANTMRKIFNL